MCTSTLLKIYNSLTNQKEDFVPIERNKVRIYVCGMTVYDYCHLGHARVMVGFDAIIRYLRYLGYDVTYVRNITDIDDKIIVRANESGLDIRKLTDRFIDCMHEDFGHLGLLKPDFEPRATDFIPQIIEMISTLIQRGFAYAADNGDVYFKVREYSQYGHLSGTNLDDVQIGARIEPGEEKSDAVDFVLWKNSKPDEPKWDSPWGAGRPGWHIECSAMSTKLLGNHFDIHGGGMDLIFPHHENEIAQSQCATGEKFVNYWMHNGYLQVDSEKMSKSLKNFFTIRQILSEDEERIRMGEILRYVFLSCHYRSPLNYSPEALENARSALERVYISLHKSRTLTENSDSARKSSYADRFRIAMNDDFNCPDALSVIFENVRDLNRAVDSSDTRQATHLRRSLQELTAVLGIGQMSPEQFLGISSKAVDKADIDQKIADRKKARKNKDWETADRIRDELQGSGVIIEDNPDGTTSWRKA